MWWGPCTLPLPFPLLPGTSASVLPRAISGLHCRWNNADVISGTVLEWSSAPCMSSSKRHVAKCKWRTYQQGSFASGTHAPRTSSPQQGAYQYSKTVCRTKDTPSVYATGLTHSLLLVQLTFPTFSGPLYGRHMPKILFNSIPSNRSDYRSRTVWPQPALLMGLWPACSLLGAVHRWGAVRRIHLNGCYARHTRHSNPTRR